MEHFTDEHSNYFLDKEWLVKIDSEHATPYLFKFHSSAVDSKSSCCILVTDTRAVWFESLSSNQFARRWRETNSLRHNTSEEQPVGSLEFLSNAHTIGNIADLSFEIVRTNYSDLAFELESEVFKWRWECNFVGPKFSADVLSKQLIMPLMSVTHLAISSADSVNELSDQDLEKAVDKVGRTARRAVDIHIKNALSKPRFATTLRRMTALFNSAPILPSILSSADKKDLDLGVPEPDMVRLGAPHQTLRNVTDTTDVKMASPRAQSPSGDNWLKVSGPKQKEANPFPEFEKQPPEDDSATDISDGEKPQVLQSNSSHGSAPLENHDTTVPKQKVPIAMKSKIIPSSSDEDTSSAPPSKKVKQKPDPSDHSGDSDSEPKRSADSSSKRGGVRQPIKRGGRRF